MTSDDWQKHWASLSEMLKAQSEALKAKRGSEPAQPIDFGDEFQTDDDGCGMSEFKRTSGGLLWSYNEDESDSRTGLARSGLAT